MRGRLVRGRGSEHVIGLRGWRMAAAIAAIAVAIGGCAGPLPGPVAATTPTPAAPRLATQADGRTILEIPGPPVPGLTTALVRQIELPGVIEANGQVAFDDRRVATIVSRVAGRIDATRVSQWDNVRRGQPIVALYSPDFMTAEAEFLQAKITARLSVAPAATQAASADFGAPAAVEGNLAGAMVMAARRKLELLGMDSADIAAIREPNPTVWMRAPISGTVLENKAMRGAAVAAGDPLYSLGTLDDVWIVASIYEDDLARIHVGQQMRATTTAYPDAVFTGVIARISPDLDPTTHTLQIRCAVRNPGARLKPQMLARVRVVTNPGEAVVAPIEALVFDTNDYFVYVALGGGRYERRRVRIGSWKEQGSVRVIAGLAAGERVVVAESIQVNSIWHQANGESS
ncbi:MAG TPA: efflux RND transporter periplasmic adaptor subunit [Candidatus Binataceae bacterium]|nr:efflux RND transporter periplasmic adaptor subunit [Candidatus Binataceae bacterium]